MSCGPQLRYFSPQAISNLCWALSRVHGVPEILKSFGACAAREAADAGRMYEFNWVDSSSIMSALMQCRLGSVPEVHTFARGLVQRAIGRTDEIGTQSLLNIALSACRLGTAQDELQHLVQDMEFAFQSRKLNRIDWRQWAQVHRTCGCS